MLKYENECCDCQAPGYPCLGVLCPRLKYLTTIVIIVEKKHNYMN